VKRTSAKLAGYARGNCAHCHEQHSSMEGSEPVPVDGAPSNYLLYTDTNPNDQTLNFCFSCHTSVGSLQTGGVTNYNYSTTFGGQSIASANTTNSIYDAFNPSNGSAHDLSAISTELQNTFSYSAAANPCGGCHNPHIARKNNNTGASYDPVKAAISRPYNRNSLWGDEDSERMLAHVASITGGAYRAPFYVGANPANTFTLHEPNGVNGNISSPVVQGSSTPDYSTFCLDCHTAGTATTTPIPWFSTDAGFANIAQHGQAVANGNSNDGNRIAPYTVDGSSGTGEDLSINFVLSCLDCHEPHGSKQVNGEYLLRTTVNGTTGITIPGSGQWYNFCVTCHTVTASSTNHAGVGGTTDCSTAACHGHKPGQYL
jgi:hypothetical protein